MKELEHTADVMYLVETETLSKLFEMAALGMFSYITDLNSVRSAECIEIRAEGYDLEGLLYKWLENLLIEHDLRGFVANSIKVNSIVISREEDQEIYRIEGSACGEIFDRNRHPPGIVIKAVTYSQMFINRDERGFWTTKIVLDI